LFGVDVCPSLSLPHTPPPHSRGDDALTDTVKKVRVKALINDKSLTAVI